MRVRWWLASGGAIAALGAAVVLWPRGGDSADPGLSIRTGTAERGAIQIVLNEVGTVEPVREIVVKPAVSGVVRTLHVREGDDIEEGARLATVEPDLNQARAVAELRAARSRARVALDQARRDFEHGRALAASDLISDNELADREAAFRQAELEIQATEEQLRIVEQAGVSSQVQALTVIAPAAGTVIRIGAEEGEAVLAGTGTLGGGTELVTIADLSRLMIEATVNEVDIGKAEIGQPVRIGLDAYPNDAWEGRISHIAPAARIEEDTRVRVFDIEVEIDAPDARLRPGMTANIDIQGARKDGVVTVPIEAVFRKDGRDVVYRIDGGRPVETPVRVGLVDAAAAEIEEGLAEGDLVALEEPPAVTGTADAG